MDSATPRPRRAPLPCYRRAFKCFGKGDGIPISDIESLLADGKGGFWLGGETALVHWHARHLGDVRERRGFRAWRVVPMDLYGWA